MPCTRRLARLRAVLAPIARPCPAVPGSAPACSRSVTFASLEASFSSVTAAIRLAVTPPAVLREHRPPQVPVLLRQVHRDPALQLADRRNQAADPPATHARSIPRSASPFPDRK